MIAREQVLRTKKFAVAQRSVVSAVFGLCLLHGLWSAPGAAAENDVPDSTDSQTADEPTPEDQSDGPQDAGSDGPQDPESDEDTPPPPPQRLPPALRRKAAEFAAMSSEAWLVARWQAGRGCF